MDYTGTSGNAAMVAGGTLAYTGVSTGTMIFLILALVLVALGVLMLIMSRHRSLRDAKAAGMNALPQGPLDE